MQRNKRHNYNVAEAFKAALPIMLGYVAIGLPAGLMEQQVGMTPLMALMMSAIFYSGAGQFMIPNMLLGGVPLLTIIASVSFVNTRQLLYSSSFAQYAQGASKKLMFFFSAGVTDESYGVSIQRFINGGWTMENALLVNFFSMSSWAISNFFGALLGSLVSIPVALGSFAMTSIFICLLVSQKFDSTVILVVVVTMVGVLFFKVIGLTAPAILFGAVCGVAAGVIKQNFTKKGGEVTQS